MLLTLLLLMVGVGAVSAETKTTGDGTEANPYTPTDLINLNKDNALPKTTIYVKGIITRVGSSKSSLKHGELDYYISNDGTKSNEIEIYGGLGLNGAKFTKTTELEAGWTVTVTGTPKEYKGTLELNYGNEITKIEKPTVPEPTISGTTSFLNNTQVTITVDNASAKVYYTLDGTTPNDKSTLYTAPFSLDKTTTVTAIAYVNGKAGKTVSMKFEKIDESQILTVAEALKKADNTEVYVKGTVVSTQKYNKKYTNLNYWITDGGASTDTLEVYRGTYLNGADITNDEQIMSGDEVILKATITTYKNSKTNVTTRELTPSTLLSLTQAKETATITDAGWATFVSKRAVDFSGSNVI